MNKVKVKKFIKKKVSKTELKEVFKIAKKIEDFLNKEETSKKISKLNVKNVVSQKIQKVITDFVVPELGFKSEKEDLFKKYETNKLRPDFFLKVRETGILLEVEKGKTITNNMDLLDLWKCHICSEANHLFLIIPQRDKAKGLNVFNNVCKRMSSFFRKENYLNINSLVIFGY